MEGHLCSWTRRLIIINTAILPQVTNRFRILCQRPSYFFFNEIIKLILKLTWKRIQNKQNNLEKEKQSWRGQIP